MKSRSKNKIEKSKDKAKLSSSGHNFPIVGSGASEGELDAYKKLPEEGEAETLTGIRVDITEQRESELKLKASEQKYRSLFETMEQGFCIIELIFDSANNPVDYLFIEANPVFEKQAGIINPVGKTIRALVPNMEESWFQIYGKVALTGEANHFTNHSQELSRWFEVSAYRLGDHESKKVAVLFTNITERKQNEETLRYRKALLEAHNEANRDGLLLVDAKGKIISYNKSFIDVWRMPQDIVDAKDDDRALAFAMTQLVNPPQFIDKVKWLYENPSETSIDELEFRDGRIIERHGYSVFGEDGTYYAWSWTFRDITEQKAAAEAIRESEMRFRTMAEATEVLIGVADEKSNVTYFNKAWVNLTGRPIEDLLKLGWADLLHPEDKDRVVNIYRAAFAKQEDYTVEFRILNRNGEYRWLLAKVPARFYPDGTFAGYISACVDITEQKKLTEELEKQVDERTKELNIKNQTFEAAEQIAKFGSYKWNIATGSLNYSDNLFRLLDCEPQEFVPSFEKFLSFIHPDDLQQVINNGEETTKTGVLIETPYRIISKTGKIKHLRSSGSFTGTDDNRILIGTVQDISKDVEVAKELEEKENYLNQIISNAPDAVIVIDEKSVITLWNPKTEEIFGWKSEEVLGLQLSDTIVPGRYREAHREGMNRLVKTGEARILNKTLELTALNKEGKEFAISLTISQASQHGNKLFIAFLRDITLEKQNQEDLIVKTTQLEKINLSLELRNKEFENAEIARHLAEVERTKYEKIANSEKQFLANMSHEIRTPMNAIIGFTKVLLRSKVSEKQKEHLHAIKTSGDALIVIINDILDLAKVDAGELVFEQTPFKMDLSVSNMLHLFDLKMEEKKLVFVKEYDNNIPKVLVGDSVRLRQIILNLMSNALKFTAKGKITVAVRLLNEDKKKATISFSFTDTGIGISEDNLKIIFKMFQQATSSTSRIYGGTGLGLAIVKQLVEKQGGTIIVKSKVNEGSTFSFTLSFKKPNADQESIREVNEDVELNTEFKDIKVLVVEDVKLNQLLMKLILNEFKFQYDLADNGKVAVEKLKTEAYDIILMDLQMPEMNGFEATDHIRNKMNSKIPIIALTADVTTVDVEKCKAVGMNDYISKPVDEKILYSKIVALVKSNDANTNKQSN